ncbi:MAG TPA: LLM class flavin-dependent oxidoreductase, partial [Acidimicrobiales bacterium]|nr:LLM class flavin-dependent oxidoreductase [Acidimicrobiales bacterium]
EGCVAELRRVWRTPRFLPPEPEPPIVIAALGPKMAAVAGRLGDGINARATDPRLADLIAVARDAHRETGRDESQFLVTVFGLFDDIWLGPESHELRQLETLGVHRVVLALSAPFDRARISAAGRHLAR